MATATKAAQNGTAATDAAVAQVTNNVVKATEAATDMVHRTTDAFAPVVKSAEARLAELSGTVTAEVKKAEQQTHQLLQTFADELKDAEAKAKELTALYSDELKKAQAAGRDWTENFGGQWSDFASRSLHSYQVAVERSLDATVSFADAMKIDWLSELTRRNAQAMTDLLNASVGQAGAASK